MASPTARRVGQLVGGLLAGALTLIALASRRRSSAPAEPPPPRTPPRASGEPANTPPDAQLALHTTARRNLRVAVLAGVSIGVTAAIALTLVIVRDRVWRLPLAAIGVLSLLAGCVFVLPRLLAPPRAPEDLAGIQGLSAKDRLQFADDRRKLQNDVRTALLQAVVGGAVLVGLLFTWQQQQATSRQVADQLTVTRQGQVGERFSRAVGQLGSNSTDVRLGALYELEQLAWQTPERRLVIIEVVAAYIREHGRPPAKITGPQTNRPPPPQDVAAALTILGRRSIHDGDPRTDLRRVNLGRLGLVRAALHQADLTGADLRGADLLGADLRGAALNEADLRGADLFFANLRGALLINANLTRANLVRANLRGALLNGANLTRARLGGDLAGADFSFTNLAGADLGFTNLAGANLRGATANRSTQWPRGFDWRGAGVKQEK